MPLNLINLDLNLLLTLDALLTEQNVTRAARRLGVGQPAVSAGLSRLRRHFGDELLTRVGNRYEPTPLALQLRGHCATALASVTRVFEAAPQFDPGEADVELTLYMSDYAAVVLGHDLGAAIAREAPGVRLRLPLHSPEVIDRAAEALRSVDGILLPHGFLRDLPHLDLFEDDWVGVVATDHPHVGEALTMDDLAALPWVQTYHRPTAYTPAEQHLRLLGIEGRTGVVVENFLTIPFFVEGTDRVAMLQRRLAHRLTGLADVRTVELPFDALPLVEAFWWHPVHTSNPAHQWLRGLLHDAAAGLTLS